MVPKSRSIFMSSTDVGGPPVCEQFHLGPRWTALSRCQNAFLLGCDGRTQPHKLGGQTWYDKSSSPPAENGREVAYQQNPTEKNHSLNLVVGILCFQIVAGTRPNARNGRKLANKGAARTTVAKWCCSTRCRPVWTSSLPLVLHVFLFVSRWPKVFFDSFWNSLYSLELPCQSQHLMVTSRWVEAFWHLLTRRINANRGHGKGESAICRVFLLLRDRHCCWAESDLGNVWLNKLGTCCGHELGKSKKSKGTRYLMQYE
jgi:hypothetical protein